MPFGLSSVQQTTVLLDRRLYLLYRCFTQCYTHNI